MNKPLISIVMPVCNCEDFLEEAIESILAQTYDHFEFIIINDGSTDGSAQIIRSYDDQRIKLITQENKGLVSSLNRGIALARGRYIARMDGDDIAKEHRFAEQITFMEEHPDYAAVGTNAEYISYDGKHIKTTHLPTEWQEIREYLKWCSPFIHSSMVLRTVSVRKVGLYRHHMHEDLDLWRRLARSWKMANLKEALQVYRMRPEGISNMPPKIFSSIDATGSKETERLLSNYYIKVGDQYRSVDNLKAARVYYKKAMGKRFGWCACKGLMMTFLPEKWHRYYQVVRRCYLYRKSLMKEVLTIPRR